MSDDLDIRAAKALGCRVEGDYVFIPDGLDIPVTLASLEIIDLKNAINKHYLKFTSSYDWAMLGAKKCFHKSGKVANEFCGKVISCGVSGITPAQITQAWVEVLESNS